MTKRSPDAAMHSDRVMWAIFKAATPIAVVFIVLMTRAALTAALRTSHETMPNVIIEGADIGDLVAYILSLKN